MKCQKGGEQKMAEVSNEVKLIVALWKEKMTARKDVLTEQCRNEQSAALSLREIEGIEFAENHLAKIIEKLEKGKL